MKKEESFLKRTMFLINILLRILIPPFYSLKLLEKYCKSSIERNPTAYLPRWFLAGLYKDHKKDKEAKREYEELWRLGYLSDRDYFDMAEVLCRLKDYDAIIKILAPIIDKYVRHKNANWCLGISYLEKEEYQKAVLYLERAIMAGSRRDEDYWRLGFCYDRLGDLEKAKEAYSTALSLKPDSKELRENLASIYIKIGQQFLRGDLKEVDLDGAEIQFRKALDTNPDDQLAIKLLENIHQIRKSAEQIVELKRKIK